MGFDPTIADNWRDQTLHIKTNGVTLFGIFSSLEFL